MGEIIETTHQRKIRERNEAVRKRFKELTDVPGQLKTPVVNRLMQEFDISSNSTIYAILKGK